MLRTLLDLDPSQEVSQFNVSVNGGWIEASVMIVAAIALAVFLYRSESRLSRGRRIFLGVCELAALLVLVLILLEPVAGIQLVQPDQRTMLVLVDSSRSMATEDQQATPPNAGSAASMKPASRFELARTALVNRESDVLAKLGEKFQVRLFSFDDQLRPEDAPENSSELFVDRIPDGATSQVGSAIEEAVAQYAGREIGGVVVMSDFAWAKGKDPVQAARDLKVQGIPVFPIGIGLAQPPDIKVRRVIAPDVVFKGDHVPIRVQIESQGFTGATVELELAADGQRVSSQQVELKGGVQFEETMYAPTQDSGMVALKVSIAPRAGETSEVDNVVTHDVEIKDEKIKVLYIEGSPRWEYRYLRQVLLHDPRLHVNFLMTQGDPALAATSPQHLGRFPQVAKDAFHYDLIILGDVPASYFNATQMGLIEDLVKTRGGSLLMIAGQSGAPGTYGETPIADILPIKLGNGQWDAINVGPVVTPAGRESKLTALGGSPEADDRIWSLVRPMYLPRLDGAKPGATVLLTKPKETEQIRDYPLVAWQRYGNGKSMFIATEDLWRMRLEVGNRYHARFWGQTIQFLALSRLLGKNKQVTLETDLRKYSSGDQVRIFANVLTQSYEPVIQPSYPVVLSRKGAEDAATEVELSSVPGTPGLYSGTYLVSQDGDYKLKTQTQDAGVSNDVDFKVKTVSLEDRDMAMQADVVRQIAGLSGGKSFELANLGDLPAEFVEERELKKVVGMQIDLWDKPILFVLLVAFAGAEWYVRRRENLV